MASRSEEELNCPVCFDIFREPVILSCSHSFCRACLQSWWTQKEVRECPVCKKVSEQKEALCNLALRNLCETLLEERLQSRSQDVCGVHGEKLKLFCLDHQQPVCVICRDAEKHSSHRFRPVGEAARQHRKELRETLERLKETLKDFHQVHVKFDQTAQHIKLQAEHTERLIKQQFNELHHFLDEEEEVRLAALREEEEQKSQVMRGKMAALSREMLRLSDTIRATEEELRVPDVSFLLNHRPAAERVHRCPLLDEPQLLPGALMEEAKHLGNLSFNIWSNMKRLVSYTPVILDPNTAHPGLFLSDDLTTVRLGRKLQLPENPERVGGFCAVLGSEGFSSGTRCWDVDVDHGTRWELGVLQESVQRKGDLRSGLWRLQLCDGTLKALSPHQISTPLPVKKLQRIRVDLDFNRGKLSLTDADANTLISSFTHTFTGRLFPYIWTGVELPLRILPVQVNVSM
ncbi:nuclear factor 7, brain-like [Leuresthes tenuis]|uniref:nuclear factor 7, brain-like n=1 Tax=Leuresthes tenuis TaxID=355514 RepID=UPI003B51000B